MTDGVLPFGTVIEEFQGSVLDVLLAHQELAVYHADRDWAGDTHAGKGNPTRRRSRDTRAACRTN